MTARSARAVATAPARRLELAADRLPFDRKPVRCVGDDRDVHQVIRLHPAAPPKPPEHAPCNGCGVCCAAAPCPLGAVASRRLHGACSALTWVESDSLYRCGLIVDPGAHLPKLLRWTAPTLAQFARRSVSAGSGCDCSLSVG